MKYFLGASVPNLGELMMPSFENSPSFHPDSWYNFIFIYIFIKLMYLSYRWLSEKYDGVRACWNSIDQNLYLLNT